MKYPMESDSLEIKNNDNIRENVIEKNIRNDSRENNRKSSRRDDKTEPHDPRQLLISLVPFVVGVLSYIHKSIPMALAIIVIDLIIVAILPVCHGRENLWYFLILAFTSIPANIWMSIKGTVFLAIEIYESKLLFIPVFILIFFGMFSIEEVVMSVVVRALWKRQKKSLLNTDVSNS